MYSYDSSCSGEANWKIIRREEGKLTGKFKMVETTNGDGELIKGDREVILESVSRFSVMLPPVTIMDLGQFSLLFLKRNSQFLHSYSLFYPLNPSPQLK